MMIEHGKRRLPLRRAGRKGKHAADGKAMAILHQGMSQITKLGWLPSAFAIEPRVRIRPALMRLVRALLAMKVALSIAATVSTAVMIIPFLRAEALHRSPGFDHRPVD